MSKKLTGIQKDYIISYLRTESLALSTLIYQIENEDYVDSIQIKSVITRVNKRLKTAEKRIKNFL